MVHAKSTIIITSGGVEPGESKEKSFGWETLEETGLRIIPESIKEYGYVLRKQKRQKEKMSLFRRTTIIFVKLKKG